MTDPVKRAERRRRIREKIREETRNIAKAALLIAKWTVGVILVTLTGTLVVRYGSAKGYYALQNGVDPDRVTIMPEPHDCDFTKAPLGDKECHYEKVVTKLRDEHGDYVIVDWKRVAD
jgi:hypothetical protein